jgi:hypothetical protein
MYDTYDHIRYCKPEKCILDVRFERGHARARLDPKVERLGENLKAGEKFEDFETLFRKFLKFQEPCTQYKVGQLYVVPHGILRVFIIILYENEFQNPQIFHQPC